MKLRPQHLAVVAVVLPLSGDKWLHHLDALKLVSLTFLEIQAWERFLGFNFNDTKKPDGVSQYLALKDFIILLWLAVNTKFWNNLLNTFLKMTRPVEILLDLVCLWLAVTVAQRLEDWPTNLEVLSFFLSSYLRRVSLIRSLK